MVWMEAGEHRVFELVSKETTYEGLKTSCRRWPGDMTDINEQR
jgi:hypothetical protein